MPVARAWLLAALAAAVGMGGLAGWAGVPERPGPPQYVAFALAPGLLAGLAQIVALRPFRRRHLWLVPAAYIGSLAAPVTGFAFAFFTFSLGMPVYGGWTPASLGAPFLFALGAFLAAAALGWVQSLILKDVPEAWWLATAAGAALGWTLPFVALWLLRADHATGFPETAAILRAIVGCLTLGLPWLAMAGLQALCLRRKAEGATGEA